MGAGAAEGPQFGVLLRGHRLRAGLTQEALSHLSGASVRALADLERGRSRGPQRRTVQALAHALALDEADTQALEHAARAGRPRPSRAQAAGGVLSLPLPRGLEDFTGRDAASSDLRELVDRVATLPPAVVVSGQPGLGKTAFAVHAAREFTSRFPDGQYCLDLRGTDEDPPSPHEALGRILSALGVAAGAVPAGTEARSGLFHTLAGQRRAVFVLDNAADEDQVGPLLPRAGRSLTLVTSRRALAGLEAVHRIELTLLDPREGLELLKRIIGAHRVQGEEQAAQDLVELCGGLPLAIRIAAQRLASRPNERLAKMATQLACEERRLDVLQAGSLRIRSAFELSYRQLSTGAQRVLRRASLTSGADFSLHGAALLSDLSVRQTALYADELVDAGLLHPHPALERFRLHDLLKVFAAEQLTSQDPPDEREKALRELDEWTLARARVAAARFDAVRRLDTSICDPDPASAPTDQESAKAWLDAEQAQWQAGLQRMLAAGRHRDVITTAEVLHWFAQLNRHWGVWCEVSRYAAQAARASGSPDDEAVQQTNLAWAALECADDPHASLAAADAAFRLAQTIGEPEQVGYALALGAAALRRLGQVEPALERLRQAAHTLAPLSGGRARLSELYTLNTLGNHLRDAGRAEEALTVHRRSNAICRAGVPDQPTELIALYQAATCLNIGNDLAALEEWAQAESWLREALAGFEAADMPSWIGQSRLALGRALARSGAPDEARQVLVDARAVLAQLGSPQTADAEAEIERLADVTGGAGLAG
ncbi:XRE family transcriptional regulator [Streptacidiphilus jiangxiensis]|uniref:Helix-turn-helix domain-containing protein n=1 Tax=Streptacidiphilus jiangxiensis TaxID=235985 RepID=A0A1H7WGQ4_STRJI|nr:XRE family transcriptional regulator [Streptacidiphilus jiangxiensis]SEM20208.1 Helix-turn-helix domain-containing protein [Streptacidiphilus jiangxiensis]